MGDRFVPLREFVVNSRQPETELVEPVVAAVTPETPPDCGKAAAEVRRFRAAIRDAVDAAVAHLLRDIAAEILARELELAPVNIDAIVERACVRYASEGVVRVRVHPDEAAQISSADVDVVLDSELRLGDALLEVRSGTIDVTLGARLAGVLDAVAR